MNAELHPAHIFEGCSVGGANKVEEEEGGTGVRAHLKVIRNCFF